MFPWVSLEKILLMMGVWFLCHGVSHEEDLVAGSMGRAEETDYDDGGGQILLEPKNTGDKIWFLDEYLLNACIKCVYSRTQPFVYLVRGEEGQDSVQPGICMTWEDLNSLSGEWRGHYVSGSWAFCLDPYVISNYEFADMDPGNDTKRVEPFRRFETRFRGDAPIEVEGKYRAKRSVDFSHGAVGGDGISDPMSLVEDIFRLFEGEEQTRETRGGKQEAKGVYSSSRGISNSGSKGLEYSSESNS